MYDLRVWPSVYEALTLIWKVLSLLYSEQSQHGDFERGMMKSARESSRELSMLGFNPERQALAREERLRYTGYFLGTKAATLGITLFLGLFSQSLFDVILARISPHWLAVLIFSYLVIVVAHAPLAFLVCLRERRIERYLGRTKSSPALGRILARYLLLMSVSTPFFAWMYGLGLEPWRKTDWNPILYVVMMSLIESLLITFPQSGGLKKPDDELLQRAERIAEQLKMKLPRLRELAGSRTQLGSAAYVLIGFWEAVFVSENLRRKLSEKELDVVLAHELAHRKEGWGLALVLLPRFFVSVVVVGLIRPHLASLYGLDQFGIAFLPLFIGLCEVGIFLALPFENMVRRWLERRADWMALKITRDPEAFVGAMVKLHDGNLVDAAPGRIWQLLFGSHPTGAERILWAKKQIRD